MRTFLTGTFAMGLVLAAFTGVAVAQPPTLSGETLSGPGVTVTSLHCGTGPGGYTQIDFTYESAGTASGPYPGTYRETGGATADNVFSARFTIDSPAGLVVGKRTGLAAETCLVGSCSSAKSCEGRDLLFGSFGGNYDALIRTRDGAFADSGTYDLLAYQTSLGYHSSFTSALGSTAAFSKDGCKNGGWRRYGFRSQGECVSLVR